MTLLAFPCPPEVHKLQEISKQIFELQTVIEHCRHKPLVGENAKKYRDARFEQKELQKQIDEYLIYV
jgi:hypothetical protein